MDKKTQSTVTPEIREAYQTALRLPKEGERLLALKDIIKEEPGFLEARRKLRELEQRKVMNTPGICRFFARLGTPAGKIKSLVKVNPTEAMKLCEDALAKTLDNVAVLDLLAEAADQVQAPFIAAEAMGYASELRPDEIRYMLRMGVYLQKAGRAGEALKRLHAVAVNYPGNRQVQNAYREAINADAKQRENPKAAMSAAATDKGGNTVGSRAAAILQLLESTIHDAAQARLVAIELQKLLAENDSMDVRKKLADAYVIMGDFDKAIVEIQKVISATSAFDPVLDKRLEEAEVGKIEKEIAQIKRRPPKDVTDPEARIAELTEQGRQLKLDHAQSRIEHYSSDIGLIYDLGMLRIERGEYDLAIEQLRKSRTSPSHEVPSRLALAECYVKQEKYKEAIEELETVLSIIPRLDKDRMRTTYFLATVLETTGENARALELYREVIKQEPRFRDAAARAKALEGSGEAPAAKPAKAAAKE